MPTNEGAVRRKTRPWRGIRPRLIAVLLVPTAAALALGGLRTYDAVERSSELARTESLATTLPTGFRLALQLQVERDAGSAAGLPPQQLAQVRATTDAAVASWRARAAGVDSSANAPLQQDLATVTDALDRLPHLRKSLATPSSRLLAQTEYTNTLNLLLGIAGRLPALGDETLLRAASALGRVRPAAEAIAVERALVAKAIEDDAIGDYDHLVLARAMTEWELATTQFAEQTDPATRARFEQILDEGGSRVQALVDQLVATRDPDGLDLDRTAWQQTTAAFLASLAEVIVGAADDLSAQVGEARESARNDAVASSTVLLLMLLLALTGALVVARSIIRPLRQLRLAALDVANDALPHRVRDIGRTDGADVADIDVSVAPLAIGNGDEIGEVAGAFDAVHAEAVRLAAEQAQVRATVNRMFVNLARRNQGLVDRQLRLIDELEAAEQDPERLASLFRLDHLATRMRRTGESLMILAGGEGHANRIDVPVLDVLRAAASAVEQYDRVEIESTEDRPMRAQVANDLVHLLAELVENATNFSPPGTPVVVRTRQDGPTADLVVEVIDQGIGMTPEELAAANEKLRRTDGLDADVARMMGLVVTSRLAARSGLSVELHSHEPSGIVARVGVPSAALAEPAAHAAAPPPRPTPGPTPGPTHGPTQRSTHAPVPPSPSVRVPAPAPAPEQTSWFGPGGPGQEPEELLSSFLARGRPAPTSAAGPATASGLPSRIPNVVPFPAPQEHQPEVALEVEREVEPEAHLEAQPEPEPQPEPQPEPLREPELREDVLDAPYAEEQDDDVSPIFARLQSEWFSPRREARVQPTQLQGPAEPPVDPDVPEWASPGDDGWRRAAELTATVEEHAPRTADGLPMRVPGRNLIPGSAETEDLPAPPPTQLRDPRRNRSLSGFQRGVERARLTEPGSATPAEEDHR
ncbi:MAG TPA: nitrate- and nitrite sensing domain-containing protein [Nocardioides sp.]|uniref:sensor histidine kinase n=1 Tax=Nocardioides sp. TaxID=35761 RepID=UPI002ED7D8B8